MQFCSGHWDHCWRDWCSSHGRKPVPLPNTMCLCVWNHAFQSCQNPGRASFFNWQSPPSRIESHKYRSQDHPEDNTSQTISKKNQDRRERSRKGRNAKRWPICSTLVQCQLHQTQCHHQELTSMMLMMMLRMWGTSRNGIGNRPRKKNDSGKNSSHNPSGGKHQRSGAWKGSESGEGGAGTEGVREWSYICAVSEPLIEFHTHLASICEKNINYSEWNSLIHWAFHVRKPSETLSFDRPSTTATCGMRGVVVSGKRPVPTSEYLPYLHILPRRAWLKTTVQVTLSAGERAPISLSCLGRLNTCLPARFVSSQVFLQIFTK